MNCSSCNANVQPESVYCPKCGVRLDTSAGLEAEGLETTVSADAALTDTAHTAPQTMSQKFMSSAPATTSDGEESANHLAGDEVWNGTYSPKAMFGAWIVLAIATLVLLILAFVYGWWKVFFIGSAVLWIGGVLKLFYNQWSVRYTLTTKRFTHEHGILRRVTDRIEVIDMDDVSVSQGLVERFTGTGTIRIVSSDRSHPEFYMHGIDNAVNIGTQMDDARRAERERRGLHIESI